MLQEPFFYIKKGAFGLANIPADVIFCSNTMARNDDGDGIRSASIADGAWTCVDVCCQFSVRQCGADRYFFECLPNGLLENSPVCLTGNDEAMMRIFKIELKFLVNLFCEGIFW